MTSPAQGSDAQTEGTSLPPPRPFGDPNTLTLPRRRRHVTRGNIVHVVEPARADAMPSLGVAIVGADATPVTITF